VKKRYRLNRHLVQKEQVPHQEPKGEEELPPDDQQEGGQQDDLPEHLPVQTESPVPQPGSAGQNPDLLPHEQPVKRRPWWL
jgi:hypothetical protein